MSTGFLRDDVLLRSAIYRHREKFFAMRFSEWCDGQKARNPPPCRGRSVRLGQVPTEEDDGLSPRWWVYARQPKRILRSPWRSRSGRGARRVGGGMLAVKLALWVLFALAIVAVGYLGVALFVATWLSTPSR